MGDEWMLICFGYKAKCLCALIEGHVPVPFPGIGIGFLATRSQVDLYVLKNSHLWG